MKFSVCTDIVFPDIQTFEAMKIVKDSGYDYFEFWGWWNKDIDAIKKASKDLDIKLAALCTRFISLTNPLVRGEYICGLYETIEVCKKLSCPLIISQVGNDTLKSREEQLESLIDGLKSVALILKESGITLVIEPLNTKYDHKGYFLSSSSEAAWVVDQVKSPNIKMLFDFYHQQITEGDIINNSVKYIDKIGHFHCAGNPGRHELNYGEIDYKEVFKALKAAGYGDCIGFEYKPLESKKSVKTLINLYKDI